MHTEVIDAFALWRQFIDSNRNSPYQGLIVPSELAQKLQGIALDHDLNVIFEIGISAGFAPVSIINILILHGAYFRLLQAGVLQRAHTRFIDSLYQSTFPELSYNVKNKDILAPWITLPAQEILLDINLRDFTVVEYGSGMSSFFFSTEAKICYSFEDDKDPAGHGSWSSNMKSQLTGQSINLIQVTHNNDITKPESVVNNLWGASGKLLISIDGCDRCKHFNEWADFIINNQNLDVLLLIDNSEINGFNDAFNALHSRKAVIQHCYGSVYGQLTTKQCTSFATFNPALLHGGCAAPSAHDQRWGRMNMQ